MLIYLHSICTTMRMRQEFTFVLLSIFILTQVHNIVDKACKELAMEKMIKDLEVSWKTLEFDHETHKVNCLKLRSSFLFFFSEREVLC